ncbi:hypothetical protein EW146_g704 [Bondarzewia mesenterica]|uniref:Uncharacterized protein n=1 Tax=Bondarzewia mesenterica TaxID=1095465 RepID=A0A4S4M892_9AGAM|nr:hypothetical protein EW146_g704 [Bondarzewia mesenterica]
MAAIYAVYTSPTHPPLPNHLPTLIVTPHGQPSNILYSYLHTNFNSENYLLTPSPQGDLCVAKLFPPRSNNNAPGKSSLSDPGHSPGGARVVRCEASRNLKWSITNTGVISPIYKLSLPSPDSPDLPLFQVSKPNPNAAFWSMFYFAYAGHNIPPKRIEFGKIQKNPPGPNGGGTRITISGKTPEEKAVWQTLGEGNEDCVEWVVLCAALNLLDDEIIKAAEKNPPLPAVAPVPNGAPIPGPGPSGRAPVSLRDPGPAPPPGPQHRGPPPPNGHPGPMPTQGPGPGGRPPQGYPPPQGFPPNQPRAGMMPPPGHGPPRRLPSSWPTPTTTATATNAEILIRRRSWRIYASSVSRALSIGHLEATYPTFPFPYFILFFVYESFTTIDGVEPLVNVVFSLVFLMKAVC